MFFFNGSVSTKIDDKNRFVLPQNMRYGLIENGVLEFTLAIGLGGALTIYRKNEIEKIIRGFQSKQYLAKYQKFFTLFFSTLHHCTCDKLGRVALPPILKKAAKIESEIIIAGVLNKIEIWPAAKYEENLMTFLNGDSETLSKVTEEVFSLLEEKQEEKETVTPLTEEEKVEYQKI